MDALVLLAGAGRGRHEDGRVAASSASSPAAVSVMYDSGLLSCTSTHSSRGASRVGHGQREGGGRVDQRTVEVAGDQRTRHSRSRRGHRLAVGAGGAPRVRGWISPTQVYGSSSTSSTGTPRCSASSRTWSRSAPAPRLARIFQGTRRSSTRVVSPTPGLTRLTSWMPYSSLIRSTAAQPSQVGARSAASSSLTSASTASGDLGEAGGDGVEEVRRRRRRRPARGRTSRRGSRPGRPGRSAARCARSGRRRWS